MQSCKYSTRHQWPCNQAVGSSKHTHNNNYQPHQKPTRFQLSRCSPNSTLTTATTDDINRSHSH